MPSRLESPLVPICREEPSVTLIVGVRFQDGVGVAGDTRVVRVDPHTGSVQQKWDNCQKVYGTLPFITAISGDVVTCAQLLIAYFQQLFFRMAREELEARATDPEWITDFFKRTYQEILARESSSQPPPVGLIIAATAATSSPVEFTGRELLDAEGFSLRRAAQVYHGAGKRVESILLGLTLPAGDLHVAQPGEAVMIGSGKYIDARLSEIPAISFGTTAGSLQARMNMIMAGFSMFGMEHYDATFNNLTHAMVKDDTGWGYVGSAHDVAAGNYDHDFGDTKPVQCEKKDLREDILYLQQQDRRTRWMEVLRKDDKWWILSYEKTFLIPLHDLVLEVHTGQGGLLQQTHLLL